jgi:hypothetical protein
VDSLRLADEEAGAHDRCIVRKIAKSRARLPLMLPVVVAAMAMAAA